MRDIVRDCEGLLHLEMFVYNVQYVESFTH